MADVLHAAFARFLLGGFAIWAVVRVIRSVFFGYRIDNSEFMASIRPPAPPKLPTKRGPLQWAIMAVQAVAVLAIWNAVTQDLPKQPMVNLFGAVVLVYIATALVSGTARMIGRAARRLWSFARRPAVHGAFAQNGQPQSDSPGPFASGRLLR